MATDPVIDQAVRNALYSVLAKITGNWDGPRFFTAEATARQIMAEVKALRKRISDLEGQVREGEPELRSQLTNAILRAENAESQIPGGKAYLRIRDLKDRAEDAERALKEAQEKIERIENYGILILDRVPSLQEVKDHADRFPVKTTLKNGTTTHGGWWDLYLGDGSIFSEILVPWNPEDPVDDRVGIVRGKDRHELGSNYGVYRAIPLKTNRHAH